ncbi:MAG TPA: hypothetical protein VIF57_13680 [Polyangia bacterium]|jgi:hypothetical protein
MLRHFVVAMLLTVWFFPPPARADGATAALPRPAPAAHQTAVAAAAVAGGVPGTDAEARRFGERERNAGDLKDFEGGGRVVIGTTTLIVILLLIIIILILL